MTSRRYIGVFRKIYSNFIQKAMTGNDIKGLEAKALEAEKLAAELRSELTKLQSAVRSSIPAQQDLVKENEYLKKEIERYKSLLSGRNSNDSIIKTTGVKSETTVVTKSEQPKVKTEEPPQPRKAGKAKTSNDGPAKPDPKSESEPPVTIDRLDLRVGKIVEVKKHPDADSLYVEQVDVGEPKPRTVVSGLVKHVPLDEMQNRMVIVLCNLKPAKMRGVTSEGMVMCASTPEKVEILLPPEGSVPGDIIQVAGYSSKPDPILNPKKKIFETVAPELKTNDACIATYRGEPWSVTGKGVVSTKSLAGVLIK